MTASLCGEQKTNKEKIEWEEKSGPKEIHKYLLLPADVVDQSKIFGQQRQNITKRPVDPVEQRVCVNIHWYNRPRRELRDIFPEWIAVSVSVYLLHIQ